MSGEDEPEVGGGPDTSRVDRGRISDALRRLITDSPDAFAILDPATQDRWQAQADGQWPEQGPIEQ
jgi:hypothetical protein